MLRLLLEKRAWAEGADGADDTPLHLAAQCAPLHDTCSGWQHWRVAAARLAAGWTGAHAVGAGSCACQQSRSGRLGIDSARRHAQKSASAALAARAAALPLQGCAVAYVRIAFKHAGHGQRPDDNRAPDARPAARARAGDMEALRALVAAVGRAAGRARNKRGLTPLGEAVAAGRADAAELLATQARPRAAPCVMSASALAGGHACHSAWLFRRGAPPRAATHAGPHHQCHCCSS